MVMKLYPEFEPAIQFAKTVGEVEYAKLMELYTAWKSGNIDVGACTLEAVTKAVTIGECNIGFGYEALSYLTSGTYNVAVGCNALASVTTGGSNIGIGYSGSHMVSTGSFNIGIGEFALRGCSITNNNIAIGGYSQYNRMNPTVTGDGNNISIGHGSMSFGTETLYNTGICNVAVGTSSMPALQRGGYNAAYGEISLPTLTDGNYNTAVGFCAGYCVTDYDNTTSLGSYATATASNQVQLGSSSTTTYVYGTVQNRSDIRDKTDVVPTTLGIDFILGLRAVEGVWDIREDYHEIVITTDTNGVATTTVVEHERDGSKKRSRKHQWFIAQEVKELCDRLGVDFGGYQDHAISGGADVLSLGYDEFIPPAVKAIQECWQRLDKLEERISKLEQ